MGGRLPANLLSSLLSSWPHRLILHQSTANPKFQIGSCTAADLQLEAPGQPSTSSRRRRLRPPDPDDGLTDESTRADSDLGIRNLGSAYVHSAGIGAWAVSARFFGPSEALVVLGGPALRVCRGPPGPPRGSAPAVTMHDFS